jgi:RNA polymerase sigma factor (sigma-70 family)
MKTRVRSVRKEAEIVKKFGWEKQGGASKEARMAMVDLYLPRFVRFVDRTYGHHFHFHKEDFEQELRCALWGATATWNPQKSSFGWYANHPCCNAVQRYIPKMMFALSYPKQGYWQRNIEAPYSDELSEETERLQDPITSPEKMAILREALGNLSQSLTETQLHTAVDVLLLERTYAEIAAKEGVSPQAIENRLCKARKNMLVSFNAKADRHRLEHDVPMASVRVRTARTNQHETVYSLPF